jgi:putative glutamine amidotransferase
MSENAKPRIAIPEPCSYDRDYSSRALRPYLKAVESCGGDAVVVPLNSTPEEVARLATGCNAILLPGSKADVDPQKFGAAKHPRTAPPDVLRDAVDELLLQDAYNMRKPIFGICYGLQSLNVWRTGTLVQHIESPVEHSPKDHDKMAHEVVIEPGSLLACSAGKQAVRVNSSHHQSAEVPGDGLRIVAKSPADGVIEALEGTSPDHYVLAVQWHPERSFSRDQPSHNLFQSFVDAAREWSEASKIGNL